MTLKLSQVVFSFVSSYIFKILISSYQNADHNFLKKYSRLTLSYLIHLALQLDCERGTIASHSTMLLRSTVRPHRRAQYLWTISYQTMDSSGRQKTNITQCIQLFHSLTQYFQLSVSFYLSFSLSLGFVSSPPQAVCEVRAKGVFPTLQVTDACSSGSVGRLSKVHLWKLFSLDILNEHLLSNPSTVELTYRTPTRHRLRAEYTIHN